MTANLVTLPVSVRRCLWARMPKVTPQLPVPKSLIPERQGPQPGVLLLWIGIIILPIVQNRCASCHAEGESAQQLTGLRLDGSHRTYELLTKNKYTREDGTVIDSGFKSGDGLTGILMCQTGIV